MHWRYSAGTFGATAHLVGLYWDVPTGSFSFSNVGGEHAANARKDPIND